MKSGLKLGPPIYVGRPPASQAACCPTLQRTHKSKRFPGDALFPGPYSGTGTMKYSPAVSSSRRKSRKVRALHRSPIPHLAGRFSSVSV